MCPCDKSAVRILGIVLSGVLCFLSAACGNSPPAPSESLSWHVTPGAAESTSAAEVTAASTSSGQSEDADRIETTTGNRAPAPSGSSTSAGGNASVDRTTASSGSVSSAPTSNNASVSVFSLADAAVLSKVKIQGRSGPVSSGVSFDWSANTLEFQAVCEGSVSLNLKEKASDTMYYTVLVDGKEQARARSSGSRLLLAENLPKGDHTFQVVRQTESFFGQVTLCSIELKGQLKSRPADRPLYMEFLGDSITVGMGNLCLGLPAPASFYSVNQDGTKSYAYYAAQALGADISVLARSGIGAYHGWDGGNPALPPMYESISYYRDKTAPWAFSRQADIVVINLGTNDLCQYLTAADRGNPAVTQYYQSFHPALFRLVGQVARSFTRAGKPLSVCGELASDPAAAPVLVGLGLRKLSMSSACAPAVKEALAGKTLAQMEALADAVCNASTAGQAQALAQG